MVGWCYHAAVRACRWFNIPASRARIKGARPCAPLSCFFSVRQGFPRRVNRPPTAPPPRDSTLRPTVSMPKSVPHAVAIREFINVFGESTSHAASMHGGPKDMSSVAPLRGRVSANRKHVFRPPCMVFAACAVQHALVTCWGIPAPQFRQHRVGGRSPSVPGALTNAPPPNTRRTAG